METNAPDCAFPELPRRLRLNRARTRLIDREKPTRRIDIKDVTGIRISSHRKGNDILVYPEFRYAGKWSKFFVGDEAIIAVARRRAVMGIRSGYPEEQLNSNFKRWLKEWRKLHRLHIVFVQDVAKKKDAPIKKDVGRKPILKDEPDNIEEPFEMPEDSSTIQQLEHFD